jgi:hypothetical protein
MRILIILLLQAQEAVEKSKKAFEDISATLKKELQQFELIKVCFL